MKLLQPVFLMHNRMPLTSSKTLLNLAIFLLGAINFSYSQYNNKYDPSNDYANKNQIILSSTNEFSNGLLRNLKILDTCIYEHNLKNLPTKRIMFSLDTLTNKWYPRSINIFDYDANGKVTYFMDSTLKASELNRRRKEYGDYSSRGNHLITYREEIWNGATWENSVKYDYIRNDSNNLSQVFSSVWDKVKQQFYHTARQTYTYKNDQIKLSEYLAENKDINANVWVPQYKIIYKLDSFGYFAETITQLFKNGVFVNGGKYEYSIDSNGRWLSEQSYIWDQLESKWMAYGNSKYTYLQDGTEITTRQIWDVTTKTWENYEKYEYKENANSTQDFYFSYNWDKSTMKYNKTYAEYSKFNTDNYEIERVYENYNNESPFEPIEVIRLKWNMQNKINTSAHEARNINSSILVYPNPCLDNLIQISSQENMQYHITNLSGVIVKQGSLHEGLNVISLSETRGIYFIHTSDRSVRKITLN